MRKGFVALGTVAALFAIAAPGQATVIDHEHYSQPFSDDFAARGFSIHLEGLATGNARNRVDKRDLDTAFFGLDNYEYTEKWTNTANGRFLTIWGNGIIRDVSATHVSGSVFRFPTVESGRPFNLSDASGRVLVRDRGAIRQTYLHQEAGVRPGDPLLEQLEEDPARRVIALGVEEAVRHRYRRDAVDLASDRCGGHAIPPRRDTGRAMSEENVEVVRRLIEHWEQGDWRWGTDVFDDECEAVFSASWFPEADNYRVGAEALRAWNGFRDAFETFEVRLDRIIDAGDRVVALTHIQARGQASGAAVDAFTGGIFTLRGGKIVRYVLTDSREALEAVGLQE